jgi:hypothetical protein
MSELSPKSERRVPVLLLAALVGQALWMSWLGFHGYPHTTSDSVCFKQPAYMRLTTPYYSIPSYEGRCPSADKLNSYPSAVYTYVNYAAFRAFGFSQFTSNAVDLLIHFSVVAIGSWSLWKLTRQQLPAILFLLGSSQWLLLSGRPEELGILLAMCALLSFEQSTVGLAIAIVCLGLAGATSPGAAVVGTTLLISYDGIRRGFDRTFWWRGLLIATLSVLIAASLYVGYVYPFVAEAFEQDRVLRVDGVYTTMPITQLMHDNPLWAVATLPILLCAIGSALYAYWKQPAWFQRDSAAGSFVLAAGLTTIVALALNILAQRLEYDFRHITALAWAALATCVSWWRTPNGAYTARAWAVAAAMLLISLPMQRDVVRQTLAPLACGEDAYDYTRAQQVVNSIVPPTASVGGDGTAWATITDGRPFLITRTVADQYWPEYVVSMNWSKRPTVLQDTEMAARLKADYEEVTPLPLLPQDGCGLNILGQNLPIATGRCDWYVRIWKRRDHSQQKAAEAEQTTIKPCLGSADAPFCLTCDKNYRLPIATRARNSSSGSVFATSALVRPARRACRIP